MRNILAVLALATALACRSAPQSGQAATTGPAGAAPAQNSDAAVGASDAAAAVTRFLTSAKGSDVVGMARVFGTRGGPLAEREPADAVEKRMRALQCYLTHDASRVIGVSDGLGGARVLVVELRQRELIRQTRFTAVAGPQRRWFVESFEINALSDFCRP